jgi:hypothetical protein
MIAGIERIKENRAERSLLRPHSNPHIIVIPDLDMPGMMAIPWAVPTHMAEKSVTISVFFSLSPIYLLIRRKEPVNIKAMPVMVTEANRPSSCERNMMPIRPVGIVPIKTIIIRCAAGRLLISFNPASPLKIPVTNSDAS